MNPGHPETLLELGSGGGNNASFLKMRFDMTLVDLSPGMLEVSRAALPLIGIALIVLILIAAVPPITLFLRECIS